MIYTIVLIVQSALLKTEKNKTSTLLHNKNVKNICDKRTLKLLQLAALQMAHQSSVISCGLFSIDWKFLFLLIAGCYSNLIVLCQFDIAGTY